MKTKSHETYTSNIIPENWYSQRGLNNLVGFSPFKELVFNYFTNDLKNIVNHIDYKHNYYVTINTFKTRKRSNDNIAGLNAIYFDVDCVKNGVSKQEFISVLPQILVECNMFYDNQIMLSSYEVDSGNGYYLIFLFKNQIIVNNPAITRLWSKLEHEIATRINNATTQFFGKKLCDTRATDPARLLRVPNTYNLKDKDKPILCHVENHTSLKYDMFKLIDEFLPPRPIKKAKKGNHTKINVKVSKNVFILNLNRCKDIEQLVEMRNFDIKGYRENLLFIYAANAIKVMDYETVVSKLDSINNSFNESLPESELKNLRYETKYLDLSKYNYSNNRIIETLNITEYEQTQLKTIISKEEKYRRNNDRRNYINRHKSLTIGAKAKREQRNKKIMDLHNQGLSYREISKSLNIGLSTVSRYLKGF
ncbi:helix-turn-helix domain-containing protein [Apilactobacillus sp. TMW 2.2459]|uniref:helix-turn-helix domain-containing protein n=1 Tax=Apilactobacillus xinyiensis TaxID=2841032 RepID=UPI00200DEB04|nr:helix-turn-helix domain-containing protein [Apilactobacillus xinyiensis]MCL0312911.1 helix-turn-helix domain-containing protein [Apilactobacillus xinyiensis]